METMNLPNLDYESIDSWDTLIFFVQISPEGGWNQDRNTE